MFVNRTERRYREDAGATVSDQQMRNLNIRYPVDRYLVESSKKFEMVNIIDEDLWNTEPALKPEDEIILRKLHEMLQSTADDLKLLSGELSKFHEPGVQIKSAPTPLDEEFNEKVHIEEIVNAKFHGYQIIDKPTPCVPEYKPRKDNNIKPTLNKQQPKVNNTYGQINTSPITKKPINKKLEITKTKIIQVNGNQDSTKTEKLNYGKVVNAPAVAYNEYSYKYVEPKLTTPSKILKVQVMPSINIRGELKEQKVLQLDIEPQIVEPLKPDTIAKNVAVIALEHEIPKPLPVPTITTEYHKSIRTSTVPKVRVITKMSTCESSASTNNVSSDTQIKLKTQKRILTNIRSPKHSSRSDRRKSNIKKENDKRSHLNLDEWRNKLNAVYGPRTSNLKPIKSSRSKTKAKVSPKKTNLLQNKSPKPSTLNNAEYIPYSKLTIGGVRASDIEREISEMPNKNNIPLSPILDRILSSRENSFSRHSPRKSNNQNVFTTSDENLLQEVMDIEKTVSETLTKNPKTSANSRQHNVSSESDEVKEDESYIDDFEDDKSDNSGQAGNQKTYSRHSNESNKTSDEENKLTSENEGADNNEKEEQVCNELAEPSTSNTNIHNLTYTKTAKLAFKNKIDIFEFIHEVDTQDTATQSSAKQKIIPQETQTTSRRDSNVQPIHNDLWPSLDPNGRVEKMFEIEKELIKKLIVEEYGDLLEKNLTKPSTSKEIEEKINVAASQKNTQTSPAHVKHVMTSPTRTKTRTTSPFKSLTVDHHTSPLIFVTNEEDVRVNIEEEEDLASSINLSSPRFSLRLPGTFREVVTNMADSSRRTDKKSTTGGRKTSAEARNSVTYARKSSAGGRHSLKNESKSTVEPKAFPQAKRCNFNITTTSTSTVEADSSDMSSLGEVKLRRMLKKNFISSDSESVSSFSSDLQSGILPLRSEGEMSLGLYKKSNKYNNYNKSEGEASFGKL